MADHSDIPLGKETQYNFQYDPGLLYPISRKEGRSALDIIELPFNGIDRWTSYELSWIDKNGKPHVVIAEFDFPCDSPNMIESKSFKLYLNSFNQTYFESPDHVQGRLVKDLSRVAGKAVLVKFYQVDEYPVVSESEFHNLDNLDISTSEYEPNAALLAFGSGQVKEYLSSHLLRSLCPVTGQPDWASVYISYEGLEIKKEALLSYIVSYRNHQGFHEQCVEMMFRDLCDQGQFSSLSVYARFLRRGGLDINPYRSTGDEPPPTIVDCRQ